jgi:AmpD protein
MTLTWHHKNIGWLEGVEWIASPNFNGRPASEEVSLIVVHNISLPAGHFSGDDVSALFCNQLDCKKHPSYKDLESLKVSAHFFVRRSGRIIQFVSVKDRAWHAGASHWQGKSNCNNFSVGIELEGTDHLAYEHEQYLALTQLTGAIQQFFPITAIAGHNDIAPERKSDPGPAFDWDYYRQALIDINVENQQLRFR